MLNPSTELFTALDTGQVTQAEYFDHVVSFWDYVLMKADVRFAGQWGYNFQEALENVREPGCPTNQAGCGSFSNLKHKALALGELYYVSYLDYARIERKVSDLSMLAGHVVAGFNWRSKLPRNRQTLYWVGEMAAELLKVALSSIK